MTVAEAIELLQRRDPEAELHVCHFARRAGQAKPIIRPVGEVRWFGSRLCVVEADDRNLYLADR